RTIAYTIRLMIATMQMTATRNRETSLVVVPRADSWRSKKSTPAGCADVMIGSELHLRRLARLRAIRRDLPQRGRGEVEHSGQHACRERLSLVVVLQHRVVERLPGERDPVLRGRELLGELLHVRARLEVRVCLNRHIESAQRRCECTLGLRELLH